MTYVLDAVEDPETLAGFIRDEVLFDGEIAKGARGRRAERVQEWLNLHGLGLAIDGDYGAITEAALKRFQDQQELPANGVVDSITFFALTAPMQKMVQPLHGSFATFGDWMAAFGKRYLTVHPREVGGQNKGPWVRFFMKGHQGRDWAWCAGFVRMLMDQAAEQSGLSKPILGSVSCDTMVSQARDKGRFLRERDARHQDLRNGDIFMVRRTATDWTHTGIVIDATSGMFGTIEGNTNDDGHREGYEVCARTRGYGSKDFIHVA